MAKIDRYLVLPNFKGTWRDIETGYPQMPKHGETVFVKVDSTMTTQCPFETGSLNRRFKLNKNVS